MRVYANKESLDFVQFTAAIDWLSLEAGHTITVHLPVDLYRGKDQAASQPARRVAISLDGSAEP